MKEKNLHKTWHLKILGCLSLMVLATGLGFSQPTGSYEYPAEIDRQIFQQLLEKGEVQNQYYNEDDVDFTIYPKTELGSALKSTWTEKKEPVFVSESLFLIEKPTGTDFEKLDTELVSRIMRSISSMEGIEYYSNSEGRNKTLYSKSYTVDKVEGSKIPDKLEGSAEGLSVYAFQEDTSFGENYYRMDYRQRENEVSMVIRLEDTLKYGLLTAVKANNLVFAIDVLDKGEYLIMYIGAKVRFPALSLFEKRLNKSFGARVTALYDWFENSYISAKQSEIK